LPLAAGWGSRFLLYTACLTQAASSGRVYSSPPLTTAQLLSIKYLSCTRAPHRAACSNRIIS
jgi:hypothetical protein